MDRIKAQWAALSTVQKVLAILFGPLILGLFIVRFGSSVSAWLNSRKRQETDEKSAELDEKKGQVDQLIARQEGKIDQIKSQRQEALEDAKDETTSDFINRRYSDPDKK